MVAPHEHQRLTLTGAFDVLGGEFGYEELDRIELLALCDVVDSKFIQFNPTIRIILYCLEFNGYMFGTQKTPDIGRKLYLRCLQAVPAWQSSTIRSKMDAYAANCLVSLFRN